LKVFNRSRSANSEYNSISYKWFRAISGYQYIIINLHLRLLVAICMQAYR